MEDILKHRGKILYNLRSEMDFLVPKLIFRIKSIKEQCFPDIETSQSICIENQLVSIWEIYGLLVGWVDGR